MSDPRLFDLMRDIEMTMLQQRHAELSASLAEIDEGIARTEARIDLCRANLHTHDAGADDDGEWTSFVCALIVTVAMIVIFGITIGWMLFAPEKGAAL